MLRQRLIQSIIRNGAPQRAQTSEVSESSEASSRTLLRTFAFISTGSSSIHGIFNPW